MFGLNSCMSAAAALGAAQDRVAVFAAPRSAGLPWARIPQAHQPRLAASTRL